MKTWAGRFAGRGRRCGVAQHNPHSTDSRLRRVRFTLSQTPACNTHHTAAKPVLYRGCTDHVIVLGYIDKVSIELTRGYVIIVAKS